MARDARSMHQFRALRTMDRFFGSTDRDERTRRYDAALARLSAGDVDLLGSTVSRIEEPGGPDGTDQPLDHFRDHWLSGSYWPRIDADRVRDTVRTGFADAILDAREAGLPLTSVWVCSTDDATSTDFRVDHVVGPTTVTVAIITPRPRGYEG